MPTLPVLNLAPTTDQRQVWPTRGARQVQITVTNAGVYLAFAYTSFGVVQGFGPEEFHANEILTINDEDIGAIQYRSALTGTPAIITIIPTT